MFHPLPEITESFEISMPELLTSRDARQARQQHWLKQHQATLISFTVVIPGPVKDSQLARKIFNQGLYALQQAIQCRQWVVLAQDSFAFNTGPESLIAISAEAEQVKALMIEIEQEFAIGRLWDFDVFNLQGQLLSRSQLNLAARTCLVCDNAAKICARQRTHSLAEIFNKIEVLANETINA